MINFHFITSFSVYTNIILQGIDNKEKRCKITKRGDNVYITFSNNMKHNITEANINFYAHPFVHPIRKMNCHDFIYILQGEWEFGQKGETYKLKKDDLLILPANNTHYGLSPCSANTKTMYFHVTCENDFISNEHSKGLCTNNHINGSLNLNIKKYFSEIVNCKLEKKHKTVLVLATAATLREQKLSRLLKAYQGRATFYTCAAPCLVRLVEEGHLDDEVARREIAALLDPILARISPDAVVLGCTHFPFVAGIISHFLGPSVPLFDGAEGTARELSRRLEAAGICNKSTKRGRLVLTASRPASLAVMQQLL